MDNASVVYERKNIDGTTDYIVSLGSVLYNDVIYNLNNIIIPIRNQQFFVPGTDKGMYAAVNVYYRPDDGVFVFHVIKKSSNVIQNVTSEVLPNHLPIAQFIIQESFDSFEVLQINQYSKMATFSITSILNPGDPGLQGPVGFTGAVGETGDVGYTGIDGDQGLTGLQGITGVGDAGATGPQGTTGIYPSVDLLFYGKFKSDDFRLTDYSVYEHDFGWGASGAGYFFYGITGGGTGMFFMPEEASSYSVEEGIIDNCHNISFNGGYSSYKHQHYMGFTGTIQAWVQLDIAPIADFTYTVDPNNSLTYVFLDTSLLFPTQWEWDVNGHSVAVKEFPYTFPTHGTYKVTLRAYNASGSSERVKFITI